MARVCGFLGCAGKIDNGVVAVNVAVSKGRCKALLDADLYLPLSWDADRPRHLIASRSAAEGIEAWSASKTAYQAGVAEAERDIAADRPKLRYGARGAWREDLARALRARFGVELVVLGCFVTAESSSFEAGYNDPIEAHIDAIHGAGAVEAVWAEIQRRRWDAYRVWAAEQGHGEPISAADGGGT
jgi:hypothetical protein